jgi:hypothetical protein
VNVWVRLARETDRAAPWHLAKAVWPFSRIADTACGRHSVSIDAVVTLPAVTPISPESGCPGCLQNLKEGRLG